LWRRWATHGLYVRAFRNEHQESWFAGVEGAFRHFGGVAEEVLLDNDRDWWHVTTG
jgi:transposase